MKHLFFVLSIFSITFLLVFNSCMEQTTEVNTPVEPVGTEFNEIFRKANPQWRIPGSYIVVFKEGITDVANLSEKLADQIDGKTQYLYQNSIKGFSVKTSETAIKKLLNNPSIAYIEEDQVVRVISTQNNATWGLDRIDQRNLPLDTRYNYNFTGSGIDVYIIDTGIRFDHIEFGGRAAFGYDAFNGNGVDGNGHGTHVAGTVGGTTYGVAKNVKLWAVRVLDNNGSGSTSGVIAGVDWVTGHHTTNPAIANMSLGGGASTALDDAVKRSILDGIVYVVAAGNSYANACNYSPARVPEAITVGSTTNTDAFSSFSNYGSCVDILAPGSNITSAWHTSSTAIQTISGTSMAAPHVAGVAALYLQENPGSSPSSVTNAIINNATVNKITNVPTGTPNRLLYSIFNSVTVPSAPTLISPTNNSTGISTSPTLSWSASSGATSYRLQVSLNSSFSSFVLDQSNISATSFTLNGLTNNTTYYWRVNASNSAGTSQWSSVWSFTTISQPCPGTRYSGTLSGTGAAQFQPSSSGYNTTVSGTHQGCLRGPNNADFDLYLQRWNGSRWVTVASSTGQTSNENISYNGTAGTYRWRIYSYRGSGTYEFYMVRP